MARTVLVLNSGSSSVKFQLVQPDSGAALADGIVERIGEDSSAASLSTADARVNRTERVADHGAALRTAFDMFAEAGTRLDDRAWWRSGTGWCTAARTSTGRR